MLRRGPVALAALAVLLASCGGDGSSVARAREDRFRGAAQALCTAVAQVAASAEADVTAARSTFYDRSHDVLHEVARDLEPLDRVTTARLLEAKQRVEAGFDTSPPDPGGLGADLSTLAAAARAALARLAVTVGPCA